MYEELTERLRKPCYDCKLWDGAMCCLDGDCTAKTRLEAADVIDELSDVARVTATIIENEQDMRVIAREPRWIPVAERLPDEDCRVLVAYPIKMKPPTIWFNVFGFTTDLSQFDSLDFPDASRPGFYDYDSEYGFIERTGITHWMPIPELKESET